MAANTDVLFILNMTRLVGCRVWEMWNRTRAEVGWFCRQAAKRGGILGLRGLC